MEEHGLEIVYIKGIHNTVADAISRLEYEPSVSVNQTAESYIMTKANKNSKHHQRQDWMAVSTHWCKLEVDTNKHEGFNLIIANHGEEDEIYPLTTIEIAKEQKKDHELKIYYNQNAKIPKKVMHFQLI